jgi:hypothetical protein
MQIDPADLRSMMREDAVGLVLGVLILVTGLLTLGLVGLLRRRASLRLWLGTFAVLYGSRLLIRTGTFRLMFDVPRSGTMLLRQSRTPFRSQSCCLRERSCPPGAASGPWALSG